MAGATVDGRLRHGTRGRGPGLGWQVAVASRAADLTNRHRTSNYEKEAAIKEMVDTDVIIVGAGPVGLFGAYYAGFRGLRCVVVDSLPQLGGQIAAMYPEKFIHDVAGFPAVRGRDLVAGLVEQASQAAAPRYLLGQTACGLSYEEERPVVELADGTRVTAQAVIVTGGIGKFVPRPLPAAGDFLGRGLAHFVPHPDDYLGLDVVIVGGGDSALDWAQGLEPLAKSVTLVHRRDRFRAHEHTVKQVRESTVRVLTGCEVSALRGAERVEAADITHLESGDVERIGADAVVAALGFSVDLGPLERWGMDIRARRIVVSTDMSTNLPRVYGAGDIVSYPGKVRLIAVGFGEVASAVNNAAVAINPDADLFPGHSTDAD
jgi:thioredoxin reductase